jgi:hypothetical protein
MIPGQVTFAIEGSEDQIATLGTLVHIPGGLTHWFRFGPGGGEMLSIMSRGNAAAFSTQVDREASETEPDFGLLLGIASSQFLPTERPARLPEEDGSTMVPRRLSGDFRIARPSGCAMSIVERRGSVSGS